nr:TSUP family transporter [Mucilaginibacter humi]
MSVIELTIIILIGSYLAGLLGSLTGLGGGFIIIPLLTTVLHVDIHYAIGASLISVIATSSGSAAAYVKRVSPICGWECFRSCYHSRRYGRGNTGHIYIYPLYSHIIRADINIISSNVTVREKEYPVKQTSYLGEKLKLNSSYPQRTVLLSMALLM